MEESVHSIVEWFQSRGLGKDMSREELVKLNFVEAGLLDSLQLVELVEFIETSFSITFREKQLGDPEFCTINGLSRIIQDARRGNS